jgi:4-hydroxy-2-oxoglutarate aldolase
MFIKKIQGVISPVIVPFKRNGDVDYDKYTSNLEKWNEEMLSGFFVISAAGESPFLTEKEKLKLVELSVQIADRNKLILVGTGMESSLESIKLTNKAATLGADAALIIPPSFYMRQMTDQVLINHFTEVAEKTDIPILIYNVPQYTNINIPIDVVQTLSKVQNIIGIKESSPEFARLVDLRKHLSDNFNILAGLASLWYPALTVGIEAGILSLANCAPNELLGILEAYKMGNIHEAFDIYMRMFPVINALEKHYGTPGMKYAAELAGYEGGEVRRPLLPLTNEEKNDLRQMLAAARLFVE